MFVTTQIATRKQENISQKVKKLAAFQLSINKIASPKRMPYLFCRSKYDVDSNYALKEINGIRHFFYESANVNSVQHKVWPHLMAKQSLICVADFEGLPQALYLKPLCWLINVSLFVTIFGVKCTLSEILLIFDQFFMCFSQGTQFHHYAKKKIFIFASSEEQANEVLLYFLHILGE